MGDAVNSDMLIGQAAAYFVAAIIPLMGIPVTTGGMLFCAGASLVLALITGMARK